MNHPLHRLALLLLAAITVVGGYAFLRYAYRVTDSTPFTQEIVLILLGTLLTILITALLLTRQTTAELDKEQTIKFVELKAATYQRLIDDLERILLRGEVHDEDVMHMEFMTHRLAVVASPAVLDEFSRFLATFSRSAQDDDLSQTESDNVSAALARLTIQIRADLIGELDARSSVSLPEIARRIVRNAQEAMQVR